MTKNKRRQIYLRTAKFFTTPEAESEACCFILLQKARLGFRAGSLTSAVCRHFPEFALFEPYPGTFLWFDNHDERVLALLFCMEMV